MNICSRPNKQTTFSGPKNTGRVRVCILMNLSIYSYTIRGSHVLYISVNFALRSLIITFRLENNTDPGEMQQNAASNLCQCTSVLVFSI